MKKVMLCSLFAVLFFFSSVISSYAATREVILATNEYVDGTGELYVPSYSKFRISVSVKSGSADRVMWILKKNGSTVDYDYRAPGTGFTYTYSSTSAGYYELILDCGGDIVRTGCSASGEIYNY